MIWQDLVIWIDPYDLDLCLPAVVLDTLAKGVCWTHTMSHTHSMVLLDSVGPHWRSDSTTQKHYGLGVT
jgi:hypothetical protein